MQEKYLQEIVDKSKQLNFYPKIGRIVPEIGDPNIREIFIYSYRLIYEITSEMIFILALIHGKRDFSHGNLNELRNKMIK